MRPIEIFWFTEEVITTCAIYIYISLKPLKSEAIHETGLSGNVVTSFFPLIIFIYIYIYIYIRRNSQRQPVITIEKSNRKNCMISILTSAFALSRTWGGLFFLV